jgi:AcrR family transcriptional regulator
MTCVTPCPVLLEHGARRLRTAEIAQAADTTESTIFRQFDGVDDLLAQA